jgi:hypothetical protein
MEETLLNGKRKIVCGKDESLWREVGEEIESEIQERHGQRQKPGAIVGGAVRVGGSGWGCAIAVGMMTI